MCLSEILLNLKQMDREEGTKECKKMGKLYIKKHSIKLSVLVCLEGFEPPISRFVVGSSS